MLGKKEASEATVASCLGTAVAYTLFSETTRSLSFEEAYHYFSLAYLSATADTRGVHAGKGIVLSVTGIGGWRLFPISHGYSNYDYYSGECGERQDRGAKPPLIEKFDGPSTGPQSEEQSEQQLEGEEEMPSFDSPGDRQGHERSYDSCGE